MALELAVHISLVSWSLFLFSTTVGQQARPEPEPKCGTITIPYPFVMTSESTSSIASSCKDYLSSHSKKWFEIECRGNQKPFLKCLNLEVANINVTINTITFMSEIHRCDNNTKLIESWVDLDGSPFRYSQRNKFVYFGCNVLAVLGSKSNNSGNSLCASSCETDSDLWNGCVGKYCCQTLLPLYLSSIRISVYTLSLKDFGNPYAPQRCKYAVIVDQAWLQRKTPKGDIDPEDKNALESVIESSKFVPVVLVWLIPNSSNITSPSKQQVNGYCKYVDTTSKTSFSGWYCICKSGFSGNPYVNDGCVDDNYRRAVDIDEGQKPTSKWAIIIGLSSSVGSIVLLIGAWRLYKILKKRRAKKLKENYFKQNGGLLLQQKLSSSKVNVNTIKVFSSKDLEKATDRFNVDRVLGKGGQGTVYKGMLVEGKIVAIKKLKVKGKAEDFINEIVILTQINHRNVVKLLGCCLETEFPLLVYEFIPNGTLYDHLQDQNDELPMTWDMRLRIATEISGALFYLHSAASQPIYHRDIKSTNILLDEKYRAKIADFGTSRMVANVEDTHLTTQVQGTLGYLDPEYYYTSQLTDKSDVYSFGVVLVELLTGKKSISLVGSDGQAISLASHFITCLEDNCLFDTLDDRVSKEGDKEHIMMVAKLAERCLNMSGKKRPTMREVNMELEGIQNSEKGRNKHQDYDEIKTIKTDVDAPWDVDSSNPVDSVSDGMASSSSEVLLLVNK